MASTFFSDHAGHLSRPEASMANASLENSSIDMLDSDGYSGSPSEAHSAFASNIQFMHEDEVVIKVSRAVFEDFQRSLTEGSADFRDILSSFLETCDFAVRTVEKLSGADRTGTDRKSRLILEQLNLEKQAYDLLIKLMDSEELAESTATTDSFLTKHFKDNQEFRRLTTMLHWSEEIAYQSSAGFSQHVKQLSYFENVNNIYAYSTMRGKSTHMDSRFIQNGIERDDEEKCHILISVIFSLLRCGRLNDTKELLRNVKQASIASFIFLREFLTNPNLSPIDPHNENFDLAKARAHFKELARTLIPVDNELITSADQCVWATLSGSLPTLLSHAVSTEDRLWSYLTCAVEASLDEFVLTEHSKNSEETLRLKNALDDDIPKTISSIFSEIKNNENSPYYSLYGYLAQNDLKGAINYIRNYIETSDDQLPAHQLRFFSHLVLLLKMTGKATFDLMPTLDMLLVMFANVLNEMKLYQLVPSYLIHISPEKSKDKMLDFLEGIQGEEVQKEVLSLALDAGFPTTELCKEVYQKFKSKHKITGDNSQTTKSASEMLRAWRWLTYGVYNRIAEAQELLSITPENLSAQVENAFEQEFGGHALPTPERLADAQQEYDCYILYFEAMSKYSAWLKHVEGSAPELPHKLSDEQWAKMDIKRRTEYEFSMQKSRDLLHKHIRLGEMLKKRSVDLLEKLLCRPNGWLIARVGDDDDASIQDRERLADFVKIRDNYFFHVARCLVDMHAKSNEANKVLSVATTLVDHRYNLHKAISKKHLRMLLGEISKSGVALI
ncbi:nuclear pore protein [Ditylenchus destructor]|nr:nuclear pore protein [Ditylenchus destructor]